MGSMIMPRLSNYLCRIIIRGAVALACFAFGRASAQEAVLLTSTVPGYPPGLVISAADRLSIPDGASATLLFRSGEMLHLRGPFEGVLGQQRSGAANGGAAVFAEMFRMQGADATVIGGTRSTRSTRPDPTLDDVEVDPQRSGTYCVGPTTSVWITHPASGSDIYALRRKGSNRTLSWPPGAERIEWPSDVPIEDGTQFEITAGGSAQATVTFHTMAPAVGGEARIASGFILGCRDQFDRQLKKLSRSVSGPELWITTDHGRHPVYHPGEAINLTVMVNVDGYLYCFMVSEESGARAVFPAGAMDGAQLLGASSLSIPGRRQPAGLVAASGKERVRCWLADRDITLDLPHGLLGTLSARLPDQLAGDLDALFVRIKGTRIASDTLTVSTESSR